MPRGGHNAKPTALRRGHSKKNLAEPKAKPLEPGVPDVLSEPARAHWKEMHDTLVSVKVLTRMDRQALIGYAEARATWEQATRELREQGLTFRSPQGLHIHPLFRIASQAQAQVLDYLREFGCTPASRAKVRTAGVVADGEEETNPFVLIAAGRHAQ